MQEDSIQQFEKLNDLQKNQFSEIFVEGFGHLLNLKKDTDKFKSLLVYSVHPLNSYAYVKDGNVAGIILLATNKLRPLKLNESEAVKLFGKFKGISMCRQINMVFQSKVVNEDTDLYIDMLAVSKNAKRQGIGRKLLEFAFSMKGFNRYYLEVLSKNKNAKRLYEKLGFIDIKNSYFSPVRLMGYGYPIKMKKSS